MFAANLLTSPPPYNVEKKTNTKATREINYRHQTHVVPWPSTHEGGQTLLELVECGDFLFRLSTTFPFAKQNSDATVALFYDMHGLKNKQEPRSLHLSN